MSQFCSCGALIDEMKGTEGKATGKLWVHSGNLTNTAREKELTTPPHKKTHNKYQVPERRRGKQRKLFLGSATSGNRITSPTVSVGEVIQVP